MFFYIVSDSENQLKYIVAKIKARGVKVNKSCLIHELDFSDVKNYESYLILFLLTQGDNDVLYKLMDKSNVEVIILENEMMNLTDRSEIAWIKSLEKKISGFIHHHSKKSVSFSRLNKNLSREKIVWIVGSSSGGPQSLSNLFGKLDKNTKDTFFIAQHLESRFFNLFISELKKVSSLPIVVVENDMEIKGSVVYILPVEKEIFFNNKKIYLKKNNVKRKYYPCIDYAIEIVALEYKSCSGVIILSGMGKDCVDGIKEVFNQGGFIMAQKPETCFADSMPSKTIETGMVNFIGSPDELATKINYKRS